MRAPLPFMGEGLGERGSSGTAEFVGRVSHLSQCLAGSPN